MKTTIIGGLAGCLLMLGFCQGGMAQSAATPALPPSILQIDLANGVQYVEDTFDVSRFATNPSITPAALLPTFVNVFGVSDIVAVNGQPARGTYTFTARRFSLTTASVSGQAIADTTRANMINQIFEIQGVDGTALGTIMCEGLGGAGTPPPGSPATQVQANTTVIGGTGAFTGVRGTCGGGTPPNPIAPRVASIVEDPAFRRKNGGGTQRLILSINPASSQLPSVTGLTFSTASAKSGDTFSATVAGSNMTDQTYFDVLFRSPGSTTDGEVFNWQQGIVQNHTVAIGTTAGFWTITGIRFHQNVNDHFTGAYVPVSVQLSVGP
jgi:hypothetical protein